VYVCVSVCNSTLSPLFFLIPTIVISWMIHVYSRSLYKRAPTLQTLGPGAPMPPGFLRGLNPIEGVCIMHEPGVTAELTQACTFGQCAKCPSI